jgi:CRISPR-associated protein Cmr4
MAQIKIDSSTGTTTDGSLRYQEELPSDTIMYSVIYWENSKNGNSHIDAEKVRESVRNVADTHIQIAGDETCGRGIFKLGWD